MQRKSETIGKKLARESEYIQALSKRSFRKIWNNDKDEIWNEYLKR